MRVGIGYDIHPLERGRRLVLGGVEIPYERGLAGHSDADVVVHALVDALFGSLALGDIGAHFPDSDPTWKGAGSLQFLRAAMDLVRSRGGRVVNADVTVVAQAPRLSPHFAAMRATLAPLLAVETDAISLKATSPEGLGALGQGAGIAALAVVCVDA